MKWNGIPSSWAEASPSSPSTPDCALHPAPSASESHAQSGGGISHSDGKKTTNQILQPKIEGSIILFKSKCNLKCRHQGKRSTVRLYMCYRPASVEVLWRWSRTAAAGLSSGSHVSDADGVFHSSVSCPPEQQTARNKAENTLRFEHKPDSSDLNKASWQRVWPVWSSLCPALVFLCQWSAGSF